MGHVFPSAILTSKGKSAIVNLLAYARRNAFKKKEHIGPPELFSSLESVALC